MNVRSIWICGLFILCCWAMPLTHADISEPQLKWSHGGCTSWCMTGWYASPAVSDLDRNGTMEVIYASYKIWVLDGTTGLEYWSVYSGHDVEYTGNDPVCRTWASPATADLDGDGTDEIITAHSDGWIGVYDITGHFFPGWPVQASPDSELRSLAVYDFEKDGRLEIIVASTSFGSDQEWYVYDKFGSIRPGWPQHEGDCYAAGCFNQNLAVADIDADGLAEIIAPNDTHYICAFSDTGACLPANSIYNGRMWGQVGCWVDLVAELRGWGNCGTEHRPNFAHSAPTIADLDRDGCLEIVLVGNVHDCSSNPYTDLYEVPIVLCPDRSRFKSTRFDWEVLPKPPFEDAWAPLSQDYNRIENCQPNPALVDLDRDGDLEIIFPAYDGKVHAFTLEKTEYGRFPFEVTHPEEGIIRFASEVAAGDLDGDGSVELVFGSWPEKSSSDSGKLHIITATGDSLYEIDLPQTPGEWNGMLGAPTLFDIDCDSELEIVAGTSSTGVIAYDLPGTVSSDIDWATSRGGFHRNGAVENPALPVEIHIELNSARFTSGETIRISLGLSNPGNPIQCDLYLITIIGNEIIFICADSRWPSFQYDVCCLTLRPLPGQLVFDPVEILDITLPDESLPSMTMDWIAGLTAAGSYELLSYDMKSAVID